MSQFVVVVMSDGVSLWVRNERIVQEFKVGNGRNVNWDSLGNLSATDGFGIEWFINPRHVTRASLSDV